MGCFFCTNPAEAEEAAEAFSDNSSTNLSLCVFFQKCLRSLRCLRWKLTNSLRINPPNPLKIYKLLLINPNVRMNKPKPKVDPIEEELKKFKKSKPIVSKAAVKRITGVSNVDAAGCFWLDTWIEQLVRERSYPPQLKSDDFYSLLGRYFAPDTILEVLEKARTDYRRAFPLADPTPPDDDLRWLPETLRADPNAIKDLPLNYLT